MNILLFLYFAILCFLSIYGLTYVIFAVLNLVHRKKTKYVFEPVDEGSVSILIPSHNEGDAILDTINTLESQDYKGVLDIYILVKDQTDTSVPALRSKTFNIINRNIHIVETGFQAKKDKINSVLDKLDSNYIAFLDADHRAMPDWISSSLYIMKKESTKIVQARRAPLAVSQLSQLWDSAQNHVGNEVLNRVFKFLGKTVFFTGTTCVFKTEVLQGRKLGDCVTEDTFLSYELITEGYKISYNDISCSYEEVAPNIRTYIHRRRRWSAGHNKTFFSYISKILKAPLFDKIQLLMHGSFYALPVAILILIFLYGLHFFMQLTPDVQRSVIIFSFVLSFIITAIFSELKFSRVFINDIIVAFLFIFPQVAAVSIYLYKLYGDETYYYILSFPYMNITWVMLWHIFLLFAPVLILLSGAVVFRQFRYYRNLLLIPTYPFFMFLDIYSCLLGFSDFIFGRFKWNKIQRYNAISVNLIPEIIQAKLGLARRINKEFNNYLIVIILAVLAVIANEVFSVDNCGEVSGLLWPPFITKMYKNSSFFVKITKENTTGDTLHLTVQTILRNRKRLMFNLTYNLDGVKIKTSRIQANIMDEFFLDMPVGWEKHKLSITADSKSYSCHRENFFSTSVKEIKEGRLYLNGEPFLIKGVIPSFSAKQLNISMNKGLDMIKKIGANTVRFYHSADFYIKKELAEHNLLLIEQPDRSTWEEIKLSSTLSINSYKRRYFDMIKKTEGFPYLLFNNVGNEWELKNSSSEIISYIFDILSKLKMRTGSDNMISYSTYFTDVRYPVDIQGINMLDTGSTYWDKAILLVKSFNKPYYASEFGGFTAFYEKPSPEIRINRLLRYWKKLMEQNASGVCFFESHDNWAQPVPVSYNNPLVAEQPDDTRGLWDNNNNAKMELPFVEQMFSDVKVEIKENIFDKNANSIKLSITNIRDFTLSNVKFNWTDGTINAGEFKPKEVKVIDVKNPMTAYTRVVFDYTTHKGLKNYSVSNLKMPFTGENIPVVLNDDFVDGKMIVSDYADIVLPQSWNGFKVNGIQYKKGTGRHKISLNSPLHVVNNLEQSTDGVNWIPFDTSKIGYGVYYLKFNIDKNRKDTLILSGTGTDVCKLRIGSYQKELTGLHPYRENIIDLTEPASHGSTVILEFNRQYIVYTKSNGSDRQGEIFINIEPPMLYSGVPLDIVRTD